MRSKSGLGGTLYQYGLCELAQRQAVFVRKDKSPDRPIKSDRAKVVMTAGCIPKTADITTFIYNIQGDRQFDNSEFWQKILTITVKVVTIRTNKVKCYEQEKSSGCLTESCGLL